MGIYKINIQKESERERERERQRKLNKGIGKAWQKYRKTESVERA